jgi:hypothetical protein
MLSLVVLAVTQVAGGCQTTQSQRGGWPVVEQQGEKKAETKAAKPRGYNSQVAIFQITMDSNLKKTLDRKKLHKTWSKMFSKDSKFRVVKQSKVDSAAKDEKKGKYVYFKLGDATRIHLHVGTTTAWKSLQGAKGPQKATLLKLTAQVGTKDEKETITITGRGVGLGGKVWPSSTLFDKVVAQELTDMANQVKAKIRP